MRWNLGRWWSGWLQTISSSCLLTKRLADSVVSPRSPPWCWRSPGRLRLCGQVSFYSRDQVSLGTGSVRAPREHQRAFGHNHACLSESYDPSPPRIHAFKKISHVRSFISTCFTIIIFIYWTYFCMYSTRQSKRFKIKLLRVSKKIHSYAIDIFQWELKENKLINSIINTDWPLYRHKVYFKPVLKWPVSECAPLPELVSTKWGKAQFTACRAFNMQLLIYVYQNISSNVQMDYVSFRCEPTKKQQQYFIFSA